MNGLLKKNSGRFKESKWLWCDIPIDGLVNSWMQFRRVFILRSIPRSAQIHVTADARYRLYVNEKHVTMGPARGFQESWPYDTMDISEFLQKGKNVICVLVHNYGVSTGQYIHEGTAGFLLAGKIGPNNISSDKKWRLRPALGFIRHMTRTTGQLGLQEFYDAQKDDGNWLSCSYDDSKWPKPYCRSFGSMPWHSVEERGIPLLREAFLAPKTITSNAKGKSKKDFQAAKDVVSLYLEEKRQWNAVNQAIQNRNGWGQFVAESLDKDSSTAYCVDFGKEVVGSIMLDIRGAKGGEIVDLIACEATKGWQPVILPITLNCHIAIGNRLILKNGRTQYEQFGQWGFRYIVLVFRNCSSKLNVKTQLRSLLYPMDVKAAFYSSSQKLNNIYEMSVLTQKNCMLDAYVDCPWREQAQWWGDARIQAKNTFILSSDAKLLARGIRQIAAQRVPNGLTYGHVPTAAHGCVLPDFTLTWILTFWDYYWQTQDLSLFRQMKGKVHEALAYFNRQMDNDKALLPYDERYWLFLDWSEIFKEGYPTLYNLWYIMALRVTVELFKLINDNESVSIYSKRLGKLTQSVKKSLFDVKNKTILAGLTKAGHPVKRNIPHNYAIAILLDIFPKNNNVYAQKGVLPVLTATHSTKSFPSPYFIHYVFEAAEKMGMYSQVLDCLEKYWGNMLDRGLTTTEENWNAKPGHWSLCHAWSAHPIVHFSEILLGIRQAAPGWKKVIFKPFFSKQKFVNGRVSTPLGTIKSSWQKTDQDVKVSLDIPAKMTCLVDIRGYKPITIKGRKHQWIIKHGT